MSVTSEPDSLITDAAKDLLVYQSEPQAQPFPSGDSSHYYEPVSPYDPDSSCPGPVTRGVILNLAFLSYNHKPQIFMKSQTVSISAPAQEHKQNRWNTSITIQTKCCTNTNNRQRLTHTTEHKGQHVGEESFMF